MRCEYCKYYYPHSDAHDFGLCKKHAPLCGEQLKNHQWLWESNARFPNINKHNYCGDFTPKELHGERLWD